MFLTLVMALVGQCQIINGRQVCSPAQGSHGVSPYTQGTPSYGYGNPYSPQVFSRPVYAQPTYPVYSQPVVVLPAATVPRTVAQPRTATRVGETIPAAPPIPRRLPADIMDRLATPQVNQAPVGQLREPRRPTAAPGPADDESQYPAPVGDASEAPIEGRNPYMPRKAPGVPQDASSGRQAVPVSQAVGSLPRRAVALPTGQVAEVPTSAESKAAGMPNGEAPSPVRSAATGKALPNYAVNGMLWNPKMKEGYQASPHAEGHAFIESLQVPEATVPDLIDDSGKIRVTIVSTNPDDRRQAVEDFKKGNGALAPFKDNVLVRSASPDSWEVKDVGISQIRQVSEGKPGVVMQEPGGKVFYASGQYDQRKSAEALRKANPGFDPKKVPGSEACPLGFTHDSWPLVIGTAIALGLLLKSKPTITA